MKKPFPLHPITIVCFVFAAYFLTQGIVKAAKKNYAVEKVISSEAEARKEPLLKIGPDMVAYLRTESGTIVDLYQLAGPTNTTFMIANVSVVDGNRTNSRAVFLSDQHQFKKGDEVTVRWIYHATPAGGHHVPFVVAKNN